MLFIKFIIVFLFVGIATKFCLVRIEIGFILSILCVIGLAEDLGVFNIVVVDSYVVFLVD